MNKTERLKNALELFQPGNTDTPILLSVTQRNDKAFKALLDRKLKSSPVYFLEWIVAGALLIGVIAFLIAFTAPGAINGGSFGGGAAALYVLHTYKNTLITAREGGIDFYFTENKFGSKDYIVYDKITLPYDRITNLRVKKGRFNTSFRFEFEHGGKTVKIVTTVSNKKRKLEDQGVNLNSFLEKVENL